MSVVFDSRDVSVGPRVGIDLNLSTSPAYVSGGSAAKDKSDAAVALSGFLKRDGDGRTKQDISPPVGKWETKVEPSSESSSIGVPSDSDEEDEQEVESKSNGSLGCLGSLEESLPIKRGLSNYFSGKSKSFANLSDVIKVKDIEKHENPLNKRRRIMIAYKWSKKSSFYGWKNPTSMPLLALNEEHETQAEDEEDEEEKPDSSSKDDEEEEQHRVHERRGFKSCFSLTELQS